MVTALYPPSLPPSSHSSCPPPSLPPQGDAVVTALQATGSAFNFLGGWLRDRMPFLQHGGEQQEQYQREAAAAAEGALEGQEQGQDSKAGAAIGNRRGGGRAIPGEEEEESAGVKLLKGALAVAVLVVALMLFRRPFASFRMMARRG